MSRSVKRGGGGYFGTKPRPENYDFQGGFSTQWKAKTLDCQKNVKPPPGPNTVYAHVGEDWGWLLLVRWPSLKY